MQHTTSYNLLETQIDLCKFPQIFFIKQDTTLRSSLKPKHGKMNETRAKMNYLLSFSGAYVALSTKLFKKARERLIKKIKTKKFRDDFFVYFLFSPIILCS